MAHPNLCLSRVDNPSSHGWMVRIRRDEIRIVKFFSDIKYGGKRHAQQAAKDFRDAELKKFTIAGIRPRAKRLVCRQKRNKTGTIGIARIERKDTSGIMQPYYAVTWRAKVGVPAGTTISIKKYGEEKAFRRAQALRNKMMMRRFGSGVFRKLKALREAKP